MDQPHDMQCARLSVSQCGASSASMVSGPAPWFVGVWSQQYQPSRHSCDARQHLLLLMLVGTCNTFCCSVSVSCCVQAAACLLAGAGGRPRGPAVLRSCSSICLVSSSISSYNASSGAAAPGPTTNASSGVAPLGLLMPTARTMHAL